ncbi:MAG: ExbD/TolR family protein [Chthoniobacterales bacterium]
MNFRKRLQPEPRGFLIAPMVDILLVLLGFFMLTWSFSRQERELDVQMPSAGEAKEQRRSVGEVIINVKADGTMVMNRRPMSPEDLLTALSRVASLYPDQAVVLRGDQRVDYGHIVQTLDLCRRANIWNVAFATATPASATTGNLPSSP